MRNLKTFESFGEIEMRFTHKRNPRLNFSVFKSKDSTILRIENCQIRFPFQIGQRISRNIETWACNNLFLIDGKDTCLEKKIFGIRTSDIPDGHEFRKIYPNKFR